MPTIGPVSSSHLHPIPAALGDAPDSGLFTRSELYQKPLIPRIQIKSLDKTQTFHTFNPFTFTGTSRALIYCNVNLSLSQHGTFEFQVDDHLQSLDIDNIKNGNRVVISMGKTNNNLFTHLSGMIRQTGYSRGCEDNLLYNVSGYGTGIRLNERILDVLLDELKTIDGSTVDQTDSDFFANRVVDDALDRASYYPKSIYSGEVEGTGGFGYINSSGATVTSPVKDFIPGVLLRFGEIEDLFSQIEGYTGARIYVDEQDRIQLQPVKTPLSTNSGFKITTNVQLDSDLADNTMYVDAETDYTFSDSIGKDSGYSNSLFGILSASVPPDKDASGANNFLENKTVEIAMRFKPITNPHWRLYAGVEGVGLTNVQSENSVRGRWRICADDNGKPQNIGGIIANRYMYPNEHYTTADGGLQTIEIFGRGSNDLDENTWYWLILSSVNATTTEYWRWYYDPASSQHQSATAAPNTSTADDGGTGWTVTNTRKMVLFQGRFKAEPHNILDVLGVRKRIMIESVIPNFPQQITSKQAAVKYLVGLIHYASRPRRIFQFPSLTVPNKPVFPGDTCCIVDDRFGFSTGGNPVIGGQITDVNYQMGIKGGGTSPSSIGQTRLQLSVVAFPGNY